jgi:D-erythro-7,8-dihydroneopterin triphosphate epimerase
MKKVESILKTDFSVSDAKITISELKLRTFIGFNPEEVTKKQDVTISAEIFYSALSASRSDNEVDILNYKIICKNIINYVEQGRFKLLEKLTADVLEIVMADPMVTSASVKIDKPHALRFAESVSIELTAVR